MTCRYHLRPYLPAPRLRDKPFHCLRCGETCNPKREQWESLEFMPRRVDDAGISHHNKGTLAPRATAGLVAASGQQGERK